MIVLDGDDSKLVDSSGRPAKRDIVQFIPINHFHTQPPQVLAKEVCVRETYASAVFIGSHRQSRH